MAPQKIHLIDGNNQFFLKYAKATSYQDLVNRCIQLNWGFDQVYWVFDGYDSRKPRRELYPEYKNTASRAKNHLDTTKYDMLNDFKKIDLPNHGGVFICERPHTEADDIIRKLAMALADGRNHITISSNDVDILNLSHLPNVFQPQAVMPKNVNNCDELNLFKTMVGDSSDNLKGLSGFGEKAWERLSEQQRKMIHYQLQNDFPNFIPNNAFSLDEKYTIKLCEKIGEHWETLKMYWRVVNYMEIPDAELIKHTRFYPKQQLVQTHAPAMTMDF